jgi:hypothetical protein
MSIKKWLLSHNIEIKLFITIWLIYAIFVTPAGGVTPNRYVDLTHAIVNEGRFEIDIYHENTIDKAYYNGHYYAGALPGPSILAVPTYIIFKGIYTLLPEKVKGMASGIRSFKAEANQDSSFYEEVDNVEFFLSQGFLVISTVSFFAALSCVLLYKSLLRLKVSPKGTLLLAFFYAFGTIQFWHATWFFEQSFTVFFLLFAFYLIFRGSQTQFSNQAIFFAGLLAACAITIEFSGAFVGFLLFFYLLSHNRKSQVLLYALGYAIPVLLLMLYNYTVFDHPFSTAYQHLAGGGYEAIVKEGFVGVSYPRFDRFIGLLLSPERGIVLFIPLIIFSFAGLVVPTERRNEFKIEAIFLALTTTVVFAFVSSFRGWNAGGAFGPRYLMFGLPFIYLPIAFIFNRLNFKVLMLTGVLSIFINWAGAQFGFAQNYYEHISQFLLQGPTLPSFEAIKTHLTSTDQFLNFLVDYKANLTTIILVMLVMVLFLIWKPKKVINEPT